MCGRGDGLQRQRELASLLQIRQHMAHLIANLQIYLQVCMSPPIAAMVPVMLLYFA